VQKCCSLGLKPINFETIQELACLSDYVAGDSDYYSTSGEFLKFKLSKLDLQLQLLDGGDAERVQGSVGLVLRF